MAKQKFIKQPTEKPVVGLETSGEEITPADIGTVEELGFVDGEPDGTLAPVTEEIIVDGGEAVLADTTTLVDAEQLDALKDTDGVLEPINPDEVPAQDKVSSVAQVMDRAQNDSRVDTTVVPEEEPATNIEPDGINTNIDISAIVKRDDLKLLEKIDLIATALGGVAGSVIRSLLALYVLGSKTVTRQPDSMNREQRALVRYFIRLASSTPEEFNHAMKYINWVYKQLTDEKVLEKELLTLVRGVSPLDPTNSSIFTVGKDDNELVTFVYLITVIDFKANATSALERSKKIDMARATTNTLLTEEIVNAINNFYAL